jgi:hypothetical protein
VAVQIVTPISIYLVGRQSPFNQNGDIGVSLFSFWFTSWNPHMICLGLEDNEPNINSLANSGIL